jgi:hypothetical protein
MVHEFADDVQVAPPGVAVATNVMPGPSPGAGVHDTTKDLFELDVAILPTGCGGPEGVAAAVTVTGLEPTALTELTDAVYATLFVNPVIVHCKILGATEHD